MKIFRCLNIWPCRLSPPKAPGFGTESSCFFLNFTLGRWHYIRFLSGTWLHFYFFAVYTGMDQNLFYHIFIYLPYFFGICTSFHIRQSQLYLDSMGFDFATGAHGLVSGLYPEMEIGPLDRASAAAIFVEGLCKMPCMPWILYLNGYNWGYTPFSDIPILSSYTNYFALVQPRGTIAVPWFKAWVARLKRCLTQSMEGQCA